VTIGADNWLPDKIIKLSSMQQEQPFAGVDREIVANSGGAK